MVGTVVLKTNQFEVKLEGIAFKVKDLESLNTMDILFPEGKVRRHRPIVGLDVMRHPRDPNILLLLLCLGIGCAIIRFDAKEKVPEPILKFLTNERICFVGFKIPEKKDLFPFEELGLRKSRVDVGYLAANLLNDPKLKKCELAELARKVIGIKNMVGIIEAWSFERHEQLKVAICEVFISSVIAMMLLDPKKKKKPVEIPKKALPTKELDSTRMPKSKRENEDEGNKGYDGCDDSEEVVISSCRNKILKGILKLPSFSNLGGYNAPSSPEPSSSPATPKGEKNARGAYLKRANSKGHNVSFRNE